MRVLGTATIPPKDTARESRSFHVTRRGRIAGLTAAAILATGASTGAGLAVAHASRAPHEDIDARLANDPKLHVGALDGDYPKRVLTRAYGDKLPKNVAAALLRYIEGTEQPDGKGNTELMLSQDLELPVDKDAPFLHPYDELYKAQVEEDARLAAQADGQ